MNLKDKWTPGPWVITGLPDMYAIHSATQEFEFVGDCNTEANAHLIAAAPDLLAACEALKNQIETEWPDMSDAFLDVYCQTLRPAIRKARGEE